MRPELQNARQAGVSGERDRDGVQLHTPLVDGGLLRYLRFVSPQSHPSRIHRAIHTVVALPQRMLLDETRDVLHRAAIPAVAAALRHFSTVRALWETYPYKASATAILDIRFLKSDAAAGQVASPRSTLMSFVAAWDHTLLLCSPDELDDVEPLVRTSLAARVQLVPREVVDARWLAVQLHALWSRSTPLTRSTAGRFPSDTYERVGKLPVDMHRWVLAALAAPMEWTAQQLANACGVSPRTLERRFAEAGLASPGRLLQEARVRALNTLIRADEEFVP